MTDFNVNYGNMYNSGDDDNDLVVKEKCSVIPIVSSIFALAFIVTMAFMMMQMINILRDMDELMKKTTGNTYAMCEMTKQISVDNTTICLN